VEARELDTIGLPIGDPETLVTLGAELGLPADEVRAMLASDAYAADVRADERRAAALGTSGVPFYVIDERYGVSGAQDPAVFLDALEQAWAKPHPLTLVGAPAAEDASCDDGSCVVVPTAEQDDRQAAPDPIIAHNIGRDTRNLSRIGLTRLHLLCYDAAYCSRERKHRSER
jgi:hypothetical protein